MVAVGPFVAFAVQVGARYAAVSVLDTRGEPLELTARWPARARIQNAITNLQDTGRIEGFGRVRYALGDGAEQLALTAKASCCGSNRDRRAAHRSGAGPGRRRP